MAEYNISYVNEIINLLLCAYSSTVLYVTPNKQFLLAVNTRADTQTRMSHTQTYAHTYTCAHAHIICTEVSYICMY